MNPEQPEGPKPRKLYTEGFKRSVVDHWITSGKPAAIVAKEFEPARVFHRRNDFISH